MKKQEMLDYIDKLIEDEIEAIDGYHKGIEKCRIHRVWLIYSAEFITTKRDI